MKSSATVKCGEVYTISYDEDRGPTIMKSSVYLPRSNPLGKEAFREIYFKD